MCLRSAAPADVPFSLSAYPAQVVASSGKTPIRREPVLGEVGDIGLQPRRRALPATPGKRSPWWWLLALPVLVAVVLLVREPLADRFLSGTRAQQLETQAAEALARGHLSAADGSGARELYQAAAAIDPDRLEPRRGLAQVADAAVSQARVALDAGRLAEAHAALSVARELSAPRAEVEAVAEALRTREASHAGIDRLLTDAETALAVRDLMPAISGYSRVLQLQPENADALRGRDDALGFLLDGAREQLRRGDISAAGASVALARAHDAGHADLPDTEARLTEELDTLRRNADRQFEQGRIDRAVASWQSLLAFDADDAAAIAGIERATDALAARAERLAGDFRFGEAGVALAQARKLGPDRASVQAADERIERARRSQSQLAASRPSGERRARAASLLQEALAAEQRGDLLSPPGDSAYDKLRAAQALAPDDPAIREAIARLLPAARQCFERSLSANSLGRAADCLDARSLLGEDAAAVAQARRRLAQRWLAIGDERLQAGSLDSAEAALRSARESDASVPGLEPFEERLRVARASGPGRY